MLDFVGNRQNIGHGHVGNLFAANSGENVLFQRPQDVPWVAVRRLHNLRIPAPGKGLHRVGFLCRFFLDSGFLAGFQTPLTDKGLRQFFDGGGNVLGDRIAAFQSHRG